MSLEPHTSAPNSFNFTIVRLTRMLHLAPGHTSSVATTQEVEIAPMIEVSEGTVGPEPSGAASTAANTPPSGPKRNWLPSWLHPFSTLRWRMTLVYITLFAIFGLLLSAFLYNAASSVLYSNGRDAFIQRITHFRAQVVNDVYCLNVPLANTYENIKQESDLDDIDAVYLVNNQGRVVASSNGTFINQRLPYIKSSFFASPHVVTTPQITHADASAGPFDTGLVSLQPPPDCQATGSVAAGYIVATTSYPVERNTLSSLLVLIGVVAFSLAALGALLVFIITGLMLKPLRQMRDATQAIALGDLHQRVRLPQTDDEIGQLATSIQRMIDQLERTTEAHRVGELRARRFFSDASHQLRTPLTSIYGFTQVLLRGAKDDPTTLQRVLRMMRNEAERMRRLVNDLMTLSRLDEGRAMNMRYVDLVEIAIEAVEQAKLMATDDRTISLYLATQERMGVQADVDNLKQAIVVLFDNALKYGRPGPDGWIKLSLDKQNGQMLVQVSDNGDGIATDDLPHIFDRFYRGQHLPTVDGQGVPVAGTGLGLSIAQAIVLAHHGTITFSSTSLSAEPMQEQGTTFTIALPSVD